MHDPAAGIHGPSRRSVSTMKFTYRLLQDGSVWFAECVEADAVGEGRTPVEAVRSLGLSLEERMLQPNAVAPPPETEHMSIVLELTTEKPLRDSLDLGGPGG